MEALRIISVLLFCSCYCTGHFIIRNHNNRQSPSFPSFNFPNFQEYYKPLYRIRYLSPQSTTENRIDRRVPIPTKVPIPKKQTTPIKQHGNGVLSIIKNLMKPLVAKMGNLHGIVKTPAKDRGMNEQHNNHGINLKVMPKLIKKGMTTYEVKNNSKKQKIKLDQSKIDVIDLANKKENNSVKHFKLNESSLDEIKKNTGHINKIEAKTIFGNFKNNKHFANIFIFYPNNDNSGLVAGLKGNITDTLIINAAKNTTKNSIDQTNKNGKEKNVVPENYGNDLVGNREEESSFDNVENRTIPTEDIVATENMVMTPIYGDDTVSTTEISVTFVDDIIENQDVNEMMSKEDENEGTVNDKNVSSSIEHDLENVVTAKPNNSPTIKDVDSTEVTTEAETKTTEDLFVTSTLLSTTTTSFYTNSVDTTVEDVTESLSEKSESIVSSTAENEITESIPESSSDFNGGINDEENTHEQDYSEMKDNKENDIDPTVEPSTLVTSVTESTFENVPEILNELKDEVVQEDNKLYDQVKEELDDKFTEVNTESTEATVTTPVASTTEDVYVTNTDAPTTTENYMETTTNTGSESNLVTDNTMESTTAQTLSTVDGETTTQSLNHTKRHFNSLVATIDDDYIEIEYTYNIFLK